MKDLAIVTGAASGMGEAAARLMADAGWPLVLCDINADRLRESIARNKLPPTTKTVAGDVSDPKYGASLVAALGGQRIGALIHAAGLSPTMADPARILEVNLGGTMRLVEAVRPHVAEGAALVLFASTAGHMAGTALDERLSAVTTPDGVPSLVGLTTESGGAYTVSKRAVQLLVRREATSFGQRGVRIVSVSPGIIDTPMGRAEMVGHPIMKAMVDSSPLKRPARPEEVAAVAVFLCSPAASFITGTDILVDGGSMTALPQMQR